MSKILLCLVITLCSFTAGVAHIGLSPDYFWDLKNLGMTRDEQQVFFNAADYFVSMWDSCDKNKVNVR